MPKQREIEGCIDTLNEFTSFKWNYEFYCKQKHIFYTVVRSRRDYESIVSSLKFHTKAYAEKVKYYPNSGWVTAPYNPVLMDYYNRGLRVSEKVGII